MTRSRGIVVIGAERRKKKRGLKRNVGDSRRAFEGSGTETWENEGKLPGNGAHHPNWKTRKERKKRGGKRVDRLTQAGSSPRNKDFAKGAHKEGLDESQSLTEEGNHQKGVKSASVPSTTVGNARQPILWKSQLRQRM